MRARSIEYEPKTVRAAAALAVDDDDREGAELTHRPRRAALNVVGRVRRKLTRGVLDQEWSKQEGAFFNGLKIVHQ